MDTAGWEKIFVRELENTHRLAQEAMNKVNAMLGSLARAQHAFAVLTGYEETPAAPEPEPQPFPKEEEPPLPFESQEKK